MLEIEENPFLSIKKQSITVVPVQQKLGLRIADKLMGILWNPGGHTINVKRNTTISYAKESDYIEKAQIDQQDSVQEVTEISHEKLPPMQEKSPLMFHHTFFTQNPT